MGSWYSVPMERRSRAGWGGNYLPQSIVSQLQKEGGYSGMTTLGGLFPEKRFVAGTPITVKTVNLATGQTEQTMIGVAYVAAETSDITELWQAFISIFFFTAVVVLCVAFITSSITSLRLTNPLKEIAETARKFGHGEYEVRVQGYEKRKDEVGELAEAFNAMADSIAKSEARRSEFVANISHELKTPMTTIAGFSDGILDGTIPPDKERAALQTISSETRRLSRLVRRVLDLSRLPSAGNVTAPAPPSRRGWPRVRNSQRPNTGNGRRSRPRTGRWRDDRQAEKADHPQPPVSHLRVSL